MMNLKKSLELYLIRHGKTPGNEEKRYVGRTEESLSKKGREELLQKKLPEAQMLFSSPMKRAIESCECLFPGKKVVMIPAFREIDFGDFEGKNYQELSENKEYQAWIDSGGTMPFPHGEGRDTFIQRSLEGYEEMLCLLRKSDVERAAAVVHGGTIMAILSAVYGGDYYDYQILNGEGYLLRMVLEDKDFRILSVERS